MPNRAHNVALAAVFGAAITVLAYPLVAPVVTSAAAGAAINWAVYIASFDISAIPSFWSSGQWSHHVTAIAGCFAVSTLILYARAAASRASGERAVDGGIYGDARVIRARADLDRRNDFWDGRGVPRSAGLVLGAHRGGYWYDASVPHSLTVGKTGSGKTQLQVLETMHLAMAAGWNIIATGKPEVLELTGDKARELGYEVVVLDLSGYPGASGYNPLDLVVEHIERGDEDAAVRCARQVAVDLIPIGGEKNTYFPKAARNALAACSLAVCTADIPREQKNLASVAALVNLGTSGEDPGDPSKPLKDYIRSLGPGHPAYAPASDLLGDGGATTAGKNVLSTLKEALSIFNDGALRGVTSASTVSIRDLMERKSAVYIEMLDEGDPYSVVFTCFLNQWWQVAQAACRENGGGVPHETAIVGDEIGNIGAKVSCLPAIATLGRSMGIHEWLFVQNLKQLNAYNEPGDGGAGRDKLLGSIGLKVALSLSEPDDFRFFSALTGKRTVRSMGTSSQRGGGRSSASTSYSEAAVPLVNEWEWQNRVAIRDGLIAVKGGENSAPGREGVFEFPLAYAGDTPAGPFFGLGSPESNRKKCADYYRRAKEAAGAVPAAPEPWYPDFAAAATGAGVAVGQDPIERDEWEAWDR